MSADSDAVWLSALDEQQFGIPIARAPLVTLDQLRPILEFCRQRAVVMLIARCPTADLPATHAMESNGFRLMDTLVYHLCDLPLPAAEGSSAVRVSVRSVQPGEEAEVSRLAADVFRAYSGHYHADPRLDRDRCDAAYASWAYRSCVSREVADDVLVAELDGRLAGFHTLRRNSASEAEWVLGGVAPWARGRGVYSSIMRTGLRWGVTHGFDRMIISTAITNMVAQRVWAGLGFRPTHAFYTFHKWFDAA